MSFEGEGGIDAGGLFRDSVRELCAELQSEGSLKLLIPCPNQKRMANGQAGWIVNPALGDKQHLEMYQFIGTIMGASLLWEASVELDLPGLIWKQLIGQKASWGDLLALDEGFCKTILDNRAASADQWAAAQQKWVVITSTGRLAELRRGGAVIPVTFNEKGEYLDACVEYRLSEGRKQIEAIRSGFFSLVPTLGLQFLDWHQVEKLVCGTPIIDIEILKKITSYNNMPGDASHPVATMFWNVMDGFTNEERAQVMAFTWGRRRMPPQVPSFQHHGLYLLIS
jgi:E3 ubiquitin-protein ligase HERC2